MLDILCFQDSKTVIIYTNDLASTPSKDILDSASQEAIDAVHGLAPIRRWCGTEASTRTTFNVPAPIKAYNLFMNRVDRVDQLRSTNPTRRKEVRVNMSLFTSILD
jgi:hypothetical protein